MNKKVLIIVVGACVVLWAVGSVVTPMLKKNNEHFPDAFNDHVLHERIKSYPTAGRAPESGEFVLPGWVPGDVTDVTIKLETTSNAKLLHFNLGDTALKLGDEEACEPGQFTDGPKLEANWFAEDAKDTSGARTDCSEQYQFRVAVKDREVYAWSNGDLSEM